MNTKYFLLAAMLTAGIWASAQAQPLKKLPESKLDAAEAEAHIRFLASDELMGRRTGEAGNNAAARYVAEQFRRYGLKTAPGMDRYMQPVPLAKTTPPKNGSLQLGDSLFTHGGNMLVFSGGNFSQEAVAVFAGHGYSPGGEWFSGLDLTGKVVVVQAGHPGISSPQEVSRFRNAKAQAAYEKGAVGLVELYNLPFPWQILRGYLSRERVSLAPENGSVPIFQAWINDTAGEMLRNSGAWDGKPAKTEVQGVPEAMLSSQNVLGVVEGTDPRLKHEYILLTAHYDHVGAGPAGGRTTPEDSIFNGARDNAFGTVALLAAAKALAARPPARSVLFAALTGEELGLLGSQFLAANSPVPLKNIVFNLNTDGAGYNDTGLVAVIGLERTGAAAEIVAGCKAFGLEVFAEPAPEQNLFDRSDNVSFAAEGVPAPTFSPGFKSFDQAIQQHYHQVSDEVETLDVAYLHRFSQAFAHTARLLANRKTAPRWSAGDKYEAAAKALYGY